MSNLTLTISDDSIRRLQIAVRTAIVEAITDHENGKNGDDGSDPKLAGVLTGVTQTLAAGASTLFTGNGNGVAQPEPAPAPREVQPTEIIPPSAAAGPAVRVTGPQFPIAALKEDARITGRAVGALSAMGITMIGQLASLGPDNLRKVKNVTSQAVDELEKCMRENGVAYVGGAAPAPAPEPLPAATVVVSAPVGSLGAALAPQQPAAASMSAFGGSAASLFAQPRPAPTPPAPTVTRGDIVYVEHMKAPMLVWEVQADGKVVVTRDGDAATALHVLPEKIVAHGLTDADAATMPAANAMVVALGRLLIMLTGNQQVVMNLVAEVFGPTGFALGQPYPPEQITRFVERAQQTLHSPPAGASPLAAMH